MSKRTLPPTASVVTSTEGARLVAPSASRNADAIGDLLARVAPHSGTALEIASGTGQHVAAFARKFPDMHWQPTDVEPDRIASINSYVETLDNVAQAQVLDATCPGWSARFPSISLIYLVNLLHLISVPEVEVLISEAAKALGPKGRLVLYGPFKRDGKLTSPGDARFHQSLTEQDPAIGYKEYTDILKMIQRSGLQQLELVEMPANNLAIVAERP